MAKLLISGIPGTGKTSLANYLEAKHGFFHIDVESDEFGPRNEFNKDPAAFLDKLGAHQNVVLSWGFRPFKDRRAVEKLIAAGFSVIWFDGDRVTSFRNFMQREHNDLMSEVRYYEQMQGIIVTRIVEAIKPKIINPYTESGEFRSLEAIANEILAE